MAGVGKPGWDENFARTEIGYLAGGAWAATQTGLAMLHARGGLVVGQAGRVSRTGAAPVGAETLERALYSSLYAAMGPRELSRQPAVQRALRDLRRNLADRRVIRPRSRRILLPAGLVIAATVLVIRFAGRSSLMLVMGLVCVALSATAAALLVRNRTSRGTRVLRGLRKAHATAANPGGAVRDGAAWTPEEVGAVVALHGNAGLVATVPRFARDGGLLDGGRSTPFHGDGEIFSLSHFDAAGSDYS